MQPVGVPVPIVTSPARSLPVIAGEVPHEVRSGADPAVRSLVPTLINPPKNESLATPMPPAKTPPPVPVEVEATVLATLILLVKVTVEVLIVEPAAALMMLPVSFAE